MNRHTAENPKATRGACSANALASQWTEKKRCGYWRSELVRAGSLGMLLGGSPMPQNACGVRILHPYLGERRIVIQDRRVPAEERKPSAYHAQGRHRPGVGDRCTVPFTRRTSALESEPYRYGWSIGTPQPVLSVYLRR